jgi:hypothetical protein
VPAGVVALARGWPWPPSQKPQDDRLACRADLGVGMVQMSKNLRKSKRDERPAPGQSVAFAARRLPPYQRPVTLVANLSGPECHPGLVDGAVTRRTGLVPCHNSDLLTVSEWAVVLLLSQTANAVW